MMKPLQNCKILITRPQHQAQALCTAIQNAGGICIALPMLKITDPTDKTELLKIINKLSDYDIAIFTSANAVLKTAPLLSVLSSNLQIAAIGPATAHALQQASIAVHLIPPSPFNSEALLNLPELKNCRDKKIVIITGENGRALLSETLKQRGALVTTAISYLRTLPKIDNSMLKHIEKQPMDIIISTSVESLQNLISVFVHSKEWLLTIPLLVVSDRAKIQATELGFKKIIQAENASDKAVLERLKIWYASAPINR
jgi:uroporphyrinogen-III synthase